MNIIDIYQVDAFADKVFKGNPAAICKLDEWFDDNVLQDIAKENNLSETAFFVKEEENYHLRWFTPEYEIDLCGHATLATAYIIFEFIDSSVTEIIFKTMSGEIKVIKDNEVISMEFPIREGMRVEVPNEIIEGLGVIPREVFKARDLMVVLESEDDIKYLSPNKEILDRVDVDGIIVTAKGDKCDFVSRFFATRSVIFEDHVTGSAHCTLVPYWSRRLNKNIFEAKQLSKRGGALYCELNEDKVKIAGKAKLYLKGQIYI